MGCNGIHHLLCQIFDEDQRGDEHIRLCHVLTETGVVLLVTELFDQIAAQLDSKFTAGRIESCCRLSQRILVLGHTRTHTHIHTVDSASETSSASSSDVLVSAVAAWVKAF